jgi:uncharacterized protein
MKEGGFVQITRQPRIPEGEFYPMINSMFEEVWQKLMPPQLTMQGLSSTRAKNVATPPDQPVPDCLTCGACCTAFLCVGVRRSDGIDPEDYWDITSDGPSGEIVIDRFLRRDPETKNCVALEGTPGEKVGCRIYEQRPLTCRQFEAGSDRCHALRRAFLFEPFLTLQEMSEAQAAVDGEASAVPDSTVIGSVRFVPEEDGRIAVRAVMMDRSERIIHSFDAAEESLFQFEFDGLPLSRAEDLIAGRNS